MKPASLDENIVYKCTDFSHKFSRQLKAEFQHRRLDITPEQLSVLVLLWYKGKATQQELSRGLDRDKTTITRVVQNMERNGLLAFSAHPTDNRSRLVSVTRKGGNLQNAAIRSSGQLYAKTLNGVDHTELRVALKVIGQMIRNCILLALFLLAGQPVLWAQAKQQNIPSLERKYKKGDQYRYKLTCESYQDGKWTSTNISVCSLTVVADSTGTPNDEITWESLKTLTPKDTLDETAKAVSIKPYRVSLTPKGPMQMPPLTEPAMTESITDFQTFFVAIAPTLDIGALKRVGDSLVKPTPVIGNFGNGKNILKGEDCLSISVKLTGLTKANASLQTSFLPPAVSCLSYLTPDMNTPVVAGSSNNFQMLMPAGPQQFFIQYGREYFVIHSTLSTADGKLTRADMFNLLTLKLKVNCDGSYQHCQAEMPISIQRKLILELL